MQSDFFIPYQSDWKEKVDPLRTPQNNPDILKAPTIYEIINEIPGVGSYFSERGGDPVVVANSHYARGAYWLTWDIEFRWGEAEVMDQVSWDKLDDYLNGKYKSGILGLGGRNKVPFSALTVWYLPGLDHKAHFKGMGEYRNYFITNTDDYIKKVVKTLKDLGEFDNKIFIIVADHGMTAMPTDLTYVSPIDELPWPAEMSCKLKLKGFNRIDIQEAEKANNNLHIWELAEVLNKLEEKMDYGLWTKDNGVVKEYLSVLTPGEIANIFKYTTAVTANKDKANIIAAFNGPMAHIYVRGDNEWKSVPNQSNIENMAEVFRLFMQINNSAEAEQKLGLSLEDYHEIRATLPRLKASVDKIMIRQSGGYEVFNGVGKPTTDLAGSEYVKGSERIEELNIFDRSGDIILIFKDSTNDYLENRYTSGVACRAWHGSLNPSDSFVPLIVTYPGGNKYELKPITDKDTICPQDHCEGNWKVKDIVLETIKWQYSND